MTSITWIADGAAIVRTWLHGAQGLSDDELAKRVVVLLQNPQVSSPQFHIDQDRGIVQVVMVPDSGVHYFVAVWDGVDLN